MTSLLVVLGSCRNGEKLKISGKFLENIQTIENITCIYNHAIHAETSCQGQRLGHAPSIIILDNLSLQRENITLHQESKHTLLALLDSSHQHYHGTSSQQEEKEQQKEKGIERTRTHQTRALPAFAR